MNNLMIDKEDHLCNVMSIVDKNIKKIGSLFPSAWSVLGMSGQLSLMSRMPSPSLSLSHTLPADIQRGGFR